MANTDSAKKMVRKQHKRYLRNKMIRSRIHTFSVKVDKAIASSDKTAALEAFRIAQKFMHKGVSKGVYKLNTISRKLRRMSARIKSMQTGVESC
jgi:small subunit ribosomal protein S20